MILCSNRFLCFYHMSHELLHFISGKFYKTTNIIENNDSYSVLLDNSKLKTPLGKELVINNKALALAVAEEWEMQKKDIITDTMHLV